MKTGRTETTVMVAGIVALGAVLRCYQLGARPLEEDELYTLRDALDLGARAAAAGGPGIRGRPLYYLLQHLLPPLHDPTPAFLRLPPLVFALLGLWVTWSLGRRVFGDVAAGVAALLAAVAPWLLYESQFARYWTLIYLLAALATLLLLLAPRASGDRRWAALALGGGSSTMLLLFAASLRTAVYADYATAMLPLVFVTAGGAVQRLSESLTRGGRAFALGATAVLVAAVLPGMASHLSDGTRFDYRPAYTYVRSAGGRGGGLLVGSPAIVARHYAPDLSYRELPSSVDTLSNWLAGLDNLWVIAPYHRNGLVADAPGLEGWLFAHCRQVLRSERPRFDYRVYRVDLYRCAGPGAAAS